jgi:hypothetical protein
MVEDAFATVPKTPVGAPGTVLGVTVDDAADAAELPAAFDATTVNVYALPFVRPLNMQERFKVFTQDVGAVTAGDEVTVYPVIALPPLEPGALQLTVEDEFPGVAPVTVGAPGGLAGVILADAADAAEVPAAFDATTVNV